MSKINLDRAYEIAQRFCDLSAEFGHDNTSDVVVGLTIFATRTARTTGVPLAAHLKLVEAVFTAPLPPLVVEPPLLDPFVAKIIEVGKSGPASLREFFDRMENALSRAESELDAIIAKNMKEDDEKK